MDSELFQSAATRHLSESLRFLRRMVEINSFTANFEGVDRVAGLIAETFAAVGFEPTVVAGPEGCGAHLFMKSEFQAGRPTIALVSHLDTVFPEEEEVRNRFFWREEGERIYGPGTNDIKGGTALIHLMLATMRDVELGLFHGVNWIVALNACEEMDSSSFGAACGREFPADTAACLIFEADGGEGDRFSVVAVRKGRATFSVEVEGKGAHAGGGHANGANAIVELSRVVTDLAALTDYAAEVTVNVGTISGGTVNNRVPHEARATLEMRAFDLEAYERTKATVLGMSGEGAKTAAGNACRIRVILEDETGPWPENEATEELITLWRTAGTDLGLRVAKEMRGGLSDGNVLWARFPTLDGLGPRGENSHCSEQSEDGRKEQEWVDVTSFVPKAALNALAISRLVEAWSPPRD